MSPANLDAKRNAMMAAAQGGQLDLHFHRLAVAVVAARRGAAHRRQCRAAAGFAWEGPAREVTMVNEVKKRTL
jgi:hypothetical protein